MPTRLQIARPDIIRYFDGLPTRVFTTRQIGGILSANRTAWRLAQATTASEFASYLCERGHLTRVELRSEAEYAPLVRYTWGTFSPWLLAQSLRKDSYLSHGTAVHLHGLTDQNPRTIFTNREQGAKGSAGASLTQDGIERAFAREQRQTRFVFRASDWRFVLLNGKNTARLEVGTVAGPSGETLQATKLERTLIDIVVRPAYAGGVYQVLEAFRTARGRMSTNVLVATLRKLGHAYPYQQAIGFYMERTGYPPESLALIERLGTPFDFFLTYGVGKSAYNSRWRLFHPQGF
jgi:predicted transcriptional regulator of viral defense system